MAATPRSPSPPPPRQRFATLSLLRKSAASKTSEQIIPRDIYQSYPVDSRTVSLGRDEDCDIRVYNGAVSRLHAEIRVEAMTDEATLVIHGSNGMKVNGTFLPAPSSHRLRSGDVLNIADRRFLWEYAEPALDWRAVEQSGIIPPSPMPARLASGGAEARRAFPPPRAETSQRQSTRLHVLPAQFASPQIKHLVRQATAGSPRSAGGSPVGGSALLGEGDESMEEAMQRVGIEDDVEAMQAQENEQEDDGQREEEEDVAWIEPKAAEELEVDEADEVAEQEQEQEQVAPGTPAATINPALIRAPIPSSFSTPLQPRRPARAPRTSLAPRTKVVRPSPARKQYEVERVEIRVEEEGLRVPPRAEVQDESGEMEESGEQEDEQIREEEDDCGEQEDVPVDAQLASPSGPLTPRSIPLPVSMDTPYAPAMDEDVSMESADDSADISIEELSEQQAQQMMTPPAPSARFVPLPASNDTPYQAAPATPLPLAQQSRAPPAPTPAFQLQTTPAREKPVVAQTPRTNGPSSMRRMALLKSARKALEMQILRQSYPESPLAQQTRITQPSPVKQPVFATPARADPQLAAPTPRHVALPSPGETAYSEDSDEDASGEIDDGAPVQLQWVHETGLEAQYETEFEEDEDDEDELVSGEESLEQSCGEEEDEKMDEQDVDASVDVDEEIADADMSVPVIGEVVPEHVVDSSSISPGMRRQLIDLLAREQGSESEGESNQMAEQNDDDDAEQDESEEQASSADESIEEQAVSERDHVMAAPPETPIARPLANRFYTPQAVYTKARLATGRQSLSARFGPPQRFGTPAKGLGPPQRPVEKPVVVGYLNDYGGPATSQRTLESEEDRIQRLARRQSLATPRALPAPPMEGFEVASTPAQQLPVPSARQSSSMAVAVSSDEEAEGSGTPLVDLRKKIKAIRRQSRQSLGTDLSQGRPVNRRLTVGLAPPVTPQGNQRDQRRQAPATAAPAARYVQHASPAPRATAPSYEEQEVDHASGAVVEEDDHGVAADTADDEEQQSTPNRAVTEPAVSNIQAKARLLATPSFKGIREMQQLPKPMATPSFVGVKQMLQEPREQTSTPDLRDLKHMMPQTRDVPATPAMTGLRHLFANQPDMASPTMEGLEEMFGQEPPTATRTAVEAPEEAPSKGRASRIGRAAAGKSTSTASAPAAKPLRVRRNVAAEETTVPARPTRTRAAPRAAAAQSAIPEEPEVASEPMKEPEAAEMEASTSSAPARRTRTGRSAEPAAAAAATAKRPTRVPTAKAIAPEPTAAKSRSKPAATPDASEPAARPARATRAAPTRVKAEPLQEIAEQDHEPESAPAPKARARAAAAAKAVQAEPTQKAPARATRATKASSAKAAAEPTKAPAPEKSVAPVKAAARTTTATRTKAKPAAAPAPEPEVVPKRVTRARK